MKADIPGYWINETTGRLRPAIESYLSGGPMTDEQIAAMRAYLRQWIVADDWRGVETLRWSVDGLTSHAAITQWLDRAIEIGIDPL
jgi:hypothetical protein